MDDDEVALKEMLHERADRVVPSFEMPARTFARAKRRRTMTAIGGTLGIAALSAAAVLGVKELRGGPSAGIGPAAPRRPARATIMVGRGADTAFEVAVSADAVWVTTSGSLVRVDPGLNRIVARIDFDPSREGSSGGHSVALGYGALWAAGNDEVVKVDPTTNRVVARVSTERADSVLKVAAGEGSVWATTSAKGGAEMFAVTRIDPRSTSIASTIQLPDFGSPVSVGEGAVWVVLPDTGSVARVDPRTGAVTTIPGLGASDLIAGGGSVWVASQRDAGLVLQIDPHASRVKSTISLGVGMEPRGLAIGAGLVWVVGGKPDGRDGIVAWIDPRSGQVLGSMRLKKLHPDGIAVGTDAVWVIDGGAATLTRIELGPVLGDPNDLPECEGGEDRSTILDPPDAPAGCVAHGEPVSPAPYFPPAP